MQLKHATEYKCILLETDYRDSAEIQLNELFKDGWQFHSVFKAGLAMVALPIMPLFIANGRNNELFEEDTRQILTDGNQGQTADTCHRFIGERSNRS
nr:MAG TPA: protein of unknown function (DUF4177) [Caudoviricetes sp.]